jgi:hypothetical protein
MTNAIHRLKTCPLNYFYVRKINKSPEFMVYFKSTIGLKTKHRSISFEKKDFFGILILKWVKIFIKNEILFGSSLKLYEHFFSKC